MVMNVEGVELKKVDANILKKTARTLGVKWQPGAGIPTVVREVAAKLRGSDDAAIDNCTECGGPWPSNLENCPFCGESDNVSVSAAGASRGSSSEEESNSSEDSSSSEASSSVIGGSPSEEPPESVALVHANGSGKTLQLGGATAETRVSAKRTEDDL